MSFDRLPQVVRPGDRLFLNDGLVQLTVERATATRAAGGRVVAVGTTTLRALELGAGYATLAAHRDADDALERMLDAAEELLDEGTFADASVQKLVTRAKSSVGAFYARFKDKEATIVFPTGYSANVGFISALMRSGDVIFNGRSKVE